MSITLLENEKRIFPRTASDLKIAAVSGVKAKMKLVDFSESGLCFEASKNIAGSSVDLKLTSENTKLDLSAKARLVWEEPLKKGGARFGGEFVDIGNKNRDALRAELIKIRIRGLLEDAGDKETKRNISHFFLKDVDAYMSSMAALLLKVAQKGDYCRDIQNEVERLNTTVLLKGYSLSLLISDQSVMRRVKENFRILVGTWVYRSRIMKRAYEKPRAYPSDFKMMEMIYQNTPISDGLGRYFDAYFLNNPNAVAIRARKGRIREMLYRFVVNNMQKKAIRIMNVASGCCRELIELVGEMQHQNALTLTCMDWDDEALDFSRAHLSNMPANIRMNFIKENLIDAINDPLAAKRLGGYDLIYNIGLTDYLPEKLLAKCLHCFESFLPVGGQMILTHKNQEKTFPSLPTDWFCNWESIPRNKSQLSNLLKKSLPNFAIDSVTDEFSYICYFTLTKVRNS